MEQFNIIRNRLRYYNNVGMTATYNVPRNLLPHPNKISVMTLLKRVLEQVISQNPILGVVVDDERAKNPQWKYLKSLDLSQIASVHSTDGVDMREMMEQAHNTPLNRAEELPGWRLSVIYEESQAARQDENLVLHVGWFFSHAIGDGIAGAAFHASFLEALNTLESHSPLLQQHDSKEEGNVIELEPKELPPCMEAAVPLHVTWWFMLKLLFRQFIYNPPDTTSWSGPSVPSTEPAQLPISTNIESLLLPHADLAKVLVQCRLQQTTLTALISVLISYYLSHKHPSFQRFAALIPFNFRKFSPALSSRDIGVFTSVTNLVFSSATKPENSEITCSSACDIFTKAFWKSARKAKAQIAERTSGSADTGAGMLKYIAHDFVGYYKSLLGQTRGHAFEVSNIGVVDGGLGGEAEAGRASFESIRFSSSASFYQGPYVLDLVSVKGGDLSICLITPDGVVSREESQEMMGYVSSSLTRLSLLDTNI